MTLKTGMVVQLKSGGPLMTVSAIVGDANNPMNAQLEKELKEDGFTDGDVECMWFDIHHALKTEYFKSAMLEEVR